ncbi:hypothetical protein C8R46DRAFT_1026406 [Mycena filopes]|nr:hypothetical protein C8R46DRAFT_1026406 [Mycena filopes]
MSSGATGSLVPDLLRDIMSRLPSTIDQKFALSQVSQFWRNAALDNCLFWTSFTGGQSRSDCYRIPIILERIGSTSALHIEFRFSRGPSDELWPTFALRALLPYAARIATLDVRFSRAVDTDALLNSDLEFPALRTLRLKGWNRRATPTMPSLLLRAPRLQTLDLEYFSPLNWSTLFPPSLEDVRIHETGNTTVETLSAIFHHCRRVSRVVFHNQGFIRSEDDEFEGFARKPLAPALRELDLDLQHEDLARVLETGFSDVVLQTLTGSISRGDISFLARTLLRGIGRLVAFDNVWPQRIELRDEDGRTVREIKILSAEWQEYLAVFEVFPPQVQHGLKICIYLEYMHGRELYMPGEVLRLPGLAQLEICGGVDDLSLATLLEVIAKLEPPSNRQVEVCIGNKRLQREGSDAILAQDLFLLVPLPEPWIFCSHCVSSATE